jgi:ankyrin repeat protein
MKSLIEAGANVNVKDRNGKTPLMVASEHSSGTVAKIQLLLDNGATLDVTDKTGKNALQLARSRSDANSAEVIVFLEGKMPSTAGEKK